MTVKLGDNSSSGAEEGPKKLGKRVGEEESLEEGEGGGGETAPNSGTKKEEERLPGSSSTSEDPTIASPNLLPPAPASSVQPAHSHDQHHFLRSSVRPQSKRLRKDTQASCSVSTGGGTGCSSSARGKGMVLLTHP